MYKMNNKKIEYQRLKLYNISKINKHKGNRTVKDTTKSNNSFKIYFKRNEQ